MTNEEDIKKIREMMEFLVKDKVASKIKSLSDTERKIYELTGEKGQSAIVSLLKVAPNTVSNLWKKLEVQGVLVKVGKGYRKVV